MFPPAEAATTMGLPTDKDGGSYFVRRIRLAGQRAILPEFGVIEQTIDDSEL